MRHIVLGARTDHCQVLAIRIGYNYQRRQELKLYDKAGLTGFSIGAGLHVKCLTSVIPEPPIRPGFHELHYRGGESRGIR